MAQREIRKRHLSTADFYRRNRINAIRSFGANEDHEEERRGEFYLGGFLLDDF